MKDYLQPAATFALALAIASLGFTLPPAMRAYGDSVYVTGEIDIRSPGYIDVKCHEGCD